MDPQRSWSQHKILAEEFCLHDEQVRLAEEVLREAQRYRSRLLAAFAVTVGRDRSVADLLGLPEREVRSARRVVGKSNARTFAGDMLETARTPEENGRAEGWGEGWGEGRGASRGEECRTTEWSGELDIVLTTGWQQGVDLHVLAAQIGTDVASVVARLKELSTQGKLRGQGSAERRGRHRKRGEAAAGGAGTDPAPPHEQPQQQGQSRTIPQDLAGSWAAWETQLTPDPHYSAEGVIGGVILEGDVWSPPRYNRH